MAGKVEGELGLKISGFQAALGKASHLMKEFGEHAKETAEKASEQLRDIAKESGGGKMANMVGLGGAAAAVVAFGAAVVETVKKSSEVYEEAETQALSYGEILGNMEAGEALEKWVHHARAGTSAVSDLEAAMKSFLEEGMSVDKAKEKLLQFQKVSLATGDSVAELAAKYQMAIAGGLDAGEGAAKLLKSGPMLMLAAEEKKKGEGEKQQAAQSKLQLDMVYHGMNSPEVAKDQEALAAVNKEIGESVHDWVKAGNLTTASLDKILLAATGPGGKFENADTLSGETQAGKKAALAEAIDEDMEKLGEAMSKGLKPALDDLTAEMPKLEKYFVLLGKATAGAIDVLVEMGGMVKKAVKTANSADNDWGDMGKASYKMLYDLQHGGLGSGAYDTAVNPNAKGKVISLENLEQHAENQVAATKDLLAFLKTMASGG